MKALLVLLVAFGSIHKLKGQHLTSDELFGKIIALRDHKIAGTGFILSSDSSMYLITAKHVMDRITLDSAKIYVRDNELKIANHYFLKSLIKREPNRRYNENSDFFIIQLFPPDSGVKARLLNSSLDFGMVALNRTALPRNVNFIAFGYPIVDPMHFTPVSFQSYVSSDLMNIKILRTTNCYCYLLDKSSMQGFSGGPVFVGVREWSEPGIEQTFLIGIITGSLNDETGGKFTIVTPAYQLLDLIRKELSNSL
jgi:hypothetical protein